MKTEIIKKPSVRKTPFIIFIIIISAFIIYYSIMSMMSPGRKIDSLRKEFGIKPAEKNGIDDRIFSDSEYLSLLKEKAYLQSRIAMAETDSIYLTVNLVDSTANIEISGVVVHTADINRMHISKILMAENETTVLTLLSTPFNISNAYSTISREPLMTKIAPKDTSEYVPDIMPDTSIVESVNYILEMTNGTRLYVYQEENKKFSDMKNLILFDIKDRLRDTWNSLKSVASLKIPEYHPSIRIRLPRADAKRIYRALPKNGQIAVFR
jgi:hypothetical protein